MSQPPYPSPQNQYAYPPAGYYGGDPMAALLAPARWAGVLLFVLGALALVFGGCFGVMGVALLSPEFTSNPEMQKALAETQLDMGTMRVVLFVLAGLIAGFGVSAGVLGFFVRRGTAGPVVTALILCGLASVMMLLWTVGGLMTGQIAAVCLLGVPTALLVFLDVMLIRALTRSGQVARARAVPQAYGGYGAGYGVGYGAGYPGAAPGQSTNPYAPPQPPPQNPYDTRR